MQETTFSNKDMLEALDYLAQAKNKDTSVFIKEILEQKKQEEVEQETLNEAQRMLEALPASTRMRLLAQFHEPNPIFKPEKERLQILTTGNTYNIKELTTWGTSDLTGSKPRKLSINGSEVNVSDWTEVTKQFVTQLLVDNVLTPEKLPVKAGKRSVKDYINSTGQQLDRKDSLFQKIADGVYVDTKYNALYHVKNMVSALEKLCVPSAYEVKIVF